MVGRALTWQQARTDVAQEREARAKEVQFAAQNRKNFLAHFGHVLEARLVNHGEQWNKEKAAIRPY